MKEIKSKILIIGSGPAGYSAAIYAARANLNPIMVQGIQPGGQLTITTDVENYPGFSEIIQGPWLMEEMKSQAEKVGCKIINDSIVNVDFSSKPFKVLGDSKTIYTSDSLILATGASAKWLGIKSERKYMGFGVSACATCDAFFYKKKHVAVVGGGNTAVEEALFLTRFASKVTLIHRRNELRADKILQDRLFSNKKIDIIWEHKVIEICGEDNPLLVNKLILSNTKTEQIKNIEIDGIFIAIGHIPNTSIFKGKLDLDDEGYILTKRGTCLTSINGVFAAGDVHDKIYRQAITAAGFGCMASLDAEKYLAEM